MTLSQITSAIRAINGEVLLCGPASFGFIIRASIKGQSCRIITLSAGKPMRCIPLEPSSQTHVASDIESLHSWLRSLSPKRALQAV
jgi:hypothetical protein